ncbi:MAG: AAA family ATPase, partial [Flavobacteriaceae bacterium]|nr:AAA family ATPase [Flavobacteriaceae bacterium]
MITTLAIKNYALIEDIRVDFNSGLTIITGETGAGKSILLGALGLVLGKRADLKVMRNSSEKCVIEAEFSIADYKLKPIFTNNDFDYEPHTILRREILPSGKSRAFINDTPVTLQQMQVLGERLIDVHSQNETHTLVTEAYQMEVLDALASNGTLLMSYSEKFDAYKKLSEEISVLISEKEQATKDHDYHSFLLKEIEESNVVEMDQTDLEETYEKLNNSEEIKEALAKALQFLSDENVGGVTAITEARAQLSAIQSYATNYDELWQRLNSAVIELEDILSELDSAAENLDADPKLLMEVNEKLQNLYRLQKKHSAGTVEELKEIRDALSEKVASTGEMEDRMEQLQYMLQTKESELTDLSDKLNTNRQNAIPILKNKLEAFLSDLGMPNARFEIQLIEEENFRRNGTTSVQVLFSANKGAAPGLLAKVASGGEMSRIMLAIKAVLNQFKQLPTLIFDEIDTG